MPRLQSSGLASEKHLSNFADRFFRPDAFNDYMPRSGFDTGLGKRPGFALSIVGNFAGRFLRPDAERGYSVKSSHDDVVQIHSGSQGPSDHFDFAGRFSGVV